MLLLQKEQSYKPTTYHSQPHMAQRSHLDRSLLSYQIIKFHIYIAQNTIN